MVINLNQDFFPECYSKSLIQRVSSNCININQDSSSASARELEEPYPLYYYFDLQSQPILGQGRPQCQKSRSNSSAKIEHTNGRTNATKSIILCFAIESFAVENNADILAIAPAVMQYVMGSCYLLQLDFQKGKNLNVSFFDQVAIDGKSVLTFEKCPLVVEPKSVAFSISALPLEDTFQIILTQFSIYAYDLSLGQKM